MKKKKITAKSERGKEIAIDYKNDKIIRYRVNGKDVPIPKKYFIKYKGIVNVDEWS